jgi:iron complex outermembrane receptor protein
MKRAICAIWLCGPGLTVFSQSADTTMVLPEFEKMELKFLQVNSLALVSEIDSTIIDFNRAGSISELLERSSTLFVRNYGPGFSVGISQRGLATAHTPIFWQGLNLNSPTTGLGDLSLIPAAFVQSMSVAHGGLSAANGSGVLAGGIYLNPTQHAKREQLSVNLLTQYTTIQNLETSFGFSILKNGWRVNTVLVNNDSKNRFLYVNHAHRNKPLETRQNSSFYQRGWLQEIEKQVGKHSVQLALWGVESNRQLAPSLTSSDNLERQNDLNLKAVLTTKLNFKHVVGKLQTAWQWDELNYSNKSGIRSDINSQQWVFNADFRQKIGSNTFINYGSNNSFQMALAGENYQRTEDQLALSVYAGINQDFLRSRLNVNLMLRQEYYQNYQNPFSPALAISYKAGKLISLLARGSRNYRIPGLNDRFWMPGGNPDLPAERAWVGEIGPEFKLRNSNGKHELKANVFGFLHQIENWIQWVPGPDFWHAVSYKSVRSSGIQSEINWKFHLKTWKLNTTISHVYVDSRNLESSFDSHIEGLNLIHIPAHKAFANISITRKQTVLMFDGNFTSSRFIGSDNVVEQPAFTLLNAGIGQNILLKQFNINLKFSVHNLLNTDYQVMPWMPMPLRYYSISIQLNFKSKLNSKS